MSTTLAPALTKRSTYYLRVFGVEVDWIEAEDAKPLVIPGFEWLPLFSHRAVDGLAQATNRYVVSEATTGAILGSDTEPVHSRTLAIRNAEAYLNRRPRTRDGVLGSIRQTSRKYGRSPWRETKRKGHNQP